VEAPHRSRRSRRVLDEVDANCTKVRELRTRGLKTGLREMEAEWKTAKARSARASSAPSASHGLAPARHAPFLGRRRTHRSAPPAAPLPQDEFRQKKAVLISKETKKRMLEQVWQDKVVIDEQEEREAAAEADAKKAEVVSLKRLNRERRLQVREQAEAVEAAVSRQEADLAAARATLEAVEAERAAVAESQQREAALHARIAAAKARLDAADGELFRAQTAVERLQRRKEEVETQAGEVEVHLRREAQDCEAVGAQLATLQQQAQSRDAQQSQSSEWRGVAERQPRGSREAAERQPRGSREAAERQSRGIRGAAEMASRCIRGDAEMLPSLRLVGSSTSLPSSARSPASPAPHPPTRSGASSQQPSPGNTSHDVSETCPRYEFAEPAGWALLLSFDQSSGRLSGGSLEAPPRERGALHTHSR